MNREASCSTEAADLWISLSLGTQGSVATMQTAMPRDSPLLRVSSPLRPQSHSAPEAIPQQNEHASSTPLTPANTSERLSYWELAQLLKLCSGACFDPLRKNKLMESHYGRERGFPWGLIPVQTGVELRTRIANLLMGASPWGEDVKATIVKMLVLLAHEGMLAQLGYLTTVRATSSCLHHCRCSRSQHERGALHVQKKKGARQEFGKLTEVNPAIAQSEALKAAGLNLLVQMTKPRHPSMHATPGHPHSATLAPTHRKWGIHPPAAGHPRSAPAVGLLDMRGTDALHRGDEMPTSTTARLQLAADNMQQVRYSAWMCLFVCAQCSESFWSSAWCEGSVAAVNVGVANWKTVMW